jgi:beta-phosphoglucomutase-like phosphatase (HAD superfamily)
VSGSLVDKKKPDPEPYLRGAEQIALAPGECIALEDSYSGISSALSAGCKTFAVGTIQDLRVNRFSDLKEATSYFFYG